MVLKHCFGPAALEYLQILFYFLIQILELLTMKIMVQLE